MFRLTAQSNVLKSRIANQVVSNARNSLNHSIRFNSVALERSASSEINNNNNNNGNNSSFNFSKTIKDVASSQNQQKEKNNAFKSYRSSNNSSSSPWFNQLNAFEDCVTQTADFNSSGSQPFFWENAQKAMNLYHELRGTPDFTPAAIGKLCHLLHSGLRANRFQLTRLSKKPDYDSKSFHTEMQNFVKYSVREIINDLLEQRVSVNENGAMHLLTSLKELKLDQEAVAVWSGAMKVETLKDTFLQPRVVGVLLPLMFEAGTPFEDVNALFQESRKATVQLHQNLAIGMIKTCLAANQDTQALTLFTELCQDAKHGKVPYMIEAHLTFIGDCKDLNIAGSFFEKAINREMPYRLNLQVNSVKSYLNNIWEETGDFNRVVDAWTKATTFYGRNIHHGISSSLNNMFFEIFFKKYEGDRIAGLAHLKDIIAVYNDIKPIDEPFFNIIISKCGVWGDKETIDSLYKAYDIYRVKKTQISRRIYLKVLGSVNSTEEEILSSWYDMLRFADYEGSTYIANADWAAIRDATVNSKTNQRNLLYCQIFKKYGAYCRDARQFKKLKQNFEDSANGSLMDLAQIDDSNVQLVDFTSIRRTHI